MTLDRWPGLGIAWCPIAYWIQFGRFQVRGTIWPTAGHLFIAQPDPYVTHYGKY